MACILCRRRIRAIGLPIEIAGKIHEERLRQFVREGYASDAHQLGRYAARRRRAILVATVVDLEARLTDAVLDMADKLIGGLFTKARNATRHRYAASAGDVGWLMRLFHGTIDALARAQADERVADTIRGRPPDQRLSACKEHAAPLMADLRDWPEATRSRISGRSDLAVAIRRPAAVEPVRRPPQARSARRGLNIRVNGNQRGGGRTL